MTRTRTELRKRRKAVVRLIPSVGRDDDDAADGRRLTKVDAMTTGPALITIIPNGCGLILLDNQRETFTRP